MMLSFCRPLCRYAIFLLLTLTGWVSLQANPGKLDSLQNKYQIEIKRSTEKIKLDGKLEEAIWKQQEPATDFWMSFPVDDRKVAEDIQTEVRVIYDEHAIYFGVICHGTNEYIIPTLKRDAREFWAGDVFAVLIDPLNKASNGFMFGVNPAGVQMELLISGRTGTRAESARRSDNASMNIAWDNTWFVEVAQGTDAWTIEMAIPFKTLRFDPERSVWGINFTRGEPRSNSWHTWSPVPVQFLTLDLGYTGAMHWDAPPAKNRSNVSVIPYSLISTVKDFEEGTDQEVQLRAGMDAKIAITSSLNLDLTINPDFSQVDVDEQVTNLTTFNVRFPERRLFFLENSDLYADFGIPPMRPFFSRRIGLDEDGNTIPIQYGARLSGNLNKDLRIGLMNMQTRSEQAYPSQNYSSLALHQRVLDRSVIKGYFHNRQMVNGGDENFSNYNRIGGLEFSYFSRDAKWRGFAGYGLSFTDGFNGKNGYYNVGIGYDGRHISAYGNLSGIGDNYYADMGWIPFAKHYDAMRDTCFHIGFQHWFSRFVYTFYPLDQSRVNSKQLGIRYLLDLRNGNLETLQERIELNYITTFSSTAALTLEATHQLNQLLYPFDFTDAEPLPVGRYLSDFVACRYQSDFRQNFSYELGLQYGTFFDGRRFEASVISRYRVQPWGNFALTFVYNKVKFDDPFGEDNLFLIGPKLEFNFSRSLFWTTFLQYNTQDDNFNINSRLQWRFKPMSDLFVVYTDNYTIEHWGPKNRALVMKINYWFNI